MVDDRLSQLLKTKATAQVENTAFISRLKSLASIYSVDLCTGRLLIYLLLAFIMLGWLKPFY